ncbi:YhcU family protein [Caldibacillus lycopersici]|uniref:YhcU family protein n=1 Tax=Perspicuibacillus lycopersici TaxID=1325689 RepID=A0AAE3IQI5_9BACI|nr:YhcU family protein [Perspicuibacillus lycopersici]MCU9612562.1 YhcU family protein [Perspicuibacillus lycopersici]
MKIVYASTPEQESKIKHLVEYFYSTIFPKYFSDDEIHSFIEWNFLNVSNQNQLSGTLKESYQIISSLEILISLIESNHMENRHHYQQMFEKNAEILNEVDMTFPFTYDQFMGDKDISLESGSIYIKAANEWLV